MFLKQSDNGLKTKKILSCLVLLTVMFSVLFLALPETAGAAGTPATELTVKLNGNLVKTYTISDLQSMTQITQGYSSIDSMPAPCMTAAQGVKVTDILTSAGIDVSSVTNITFKATDGYITSLTKQYLLDAVRYYYPNITNYWDTVNKCTYGAALDGGIQVDPILALISYYKRFDPAPEFNRMDNANALRLCFGQDPNNINEVTSNRFAKWVNEIDVDGNLLPGVVTISSPIEGADFKPGNTISVIGTAQNLTTINFKVTDPNNTEVFNQDLDVSGGVFKPSFTISYAPAYGTYTITVTGAGLTNPYIVHFTISEPSPLLIDGSGVVAPVTIPYSEIQTMPQIQQLFSNVDDNGNFKTYATLGVKLDDIIARAPLNGVPYQYSFIGSDGFTRSVTKQDLDNACNYYTGSNATEPAGTVAPVIALEYNGNGDFNQMSTNGCLRNFYGQSSSTDHTMGNYVKNLVEIQVSCAAAHSQPPVLTAGANNTIGQAVNLSFTDDQNWRNAVTGITVNGASISCNYTLAAGVITIDGSVFNAAGSYDIAVQATGYQDATVTVTVSNGGGGGGGGTGSPVYTVTPVKDAACQIGSTDGIATMTVNSGVSGMKYFAAQVEPVIAHDGTEAAVFVHLRNGLQDNINVTKADFDAAGVAQAQAGFNVRPGDVIKVYLVDDLTNAAYFNPTVLQ